jgi:metal-dependent HD superfamily phosphatase/phosphodiesterase
MEASLNDGPRAVSKSGSPGGASDLLSQLGRRFPQVEIPAGVLSYVEEQESNGHRIRRAESGEPLDHYLQRIGVHEEIITRFLDDDSRLVAKLSYPSLLERPVDEVSSRLEEHFAVVFVLQQAVLDSEVLTGFNRHGGDHLRSVSGRMLELIRAGEAESEPGALAEKEAIIAGYLHDSGNLISRQYHGPYGVYLLSQFFSRVDRDEETLASFMRVLEAVFFHEVEIGLRLPSLAGLHAATLSLIIADKTDVSARRVSAKSNVPEAIRDAHTLVNLLTVDSKIGLRSKEFVWDLHFSPRAGSEDVARFSQLLKGSERVWVPQAWQRLYREHNVEYLFVFHGTFLKLYLARLLYAIRAVFELYPRVPRFRLIVDDTERGISLSRVFGRKDYEEKIGLIGKNLFKDNWEETYLYQSLWWPETVGGESTVADTATGGTD